MQRAEWEFAHNPPVYQAGLYVKSKFDLPPERLRLFEGEHGLFGDDFITMIPTPGHTPGHQSLLARGHHAVLLTADAAY